MPGQYPEAPVMSSTKRARGYDDDDDERETADNISIVMGSTSNAVEADENTAQARITEGIAVKGPTGSIATIDERTVKVGVAEETTFKESARNVAVTKRIMIKTGMTPNDQFKMPGQYLETQATNTPKVHQAAGAIFATIVTGAKKLLKRARGDDEDEDKEAVDKMAPKLKTVKLETDTKIEVGTITPTVANEPEIKTAKTKDAIIKAAQTKAATTKAAQTKAATTKTITTSVAAAKDVPPKDTTSKQAVINPASVKTAVPQKTTERVGAAESVASRKATIAIPSDHLVSFIHPAKRPHSLSLPESMNAEEQRGSRDQKDHSQRKIKQRRSNGSNGEKQKMDTAATKADFPAARGSTSCSSAAIVDSAGAGYFGDAKDVKKNSPETAGYRTSEASSLPALPIAVDAEPPKDVLKNNRPSASLDVPSLNSVHFSGQSGDDKDIKTDAADTARCLTSGATSSSPPPVAAAAKLRKDALQSNDTSVSDVVQPAYSVPLSDQSEYRKDTKKDDSAEAGGCLLQAPLLLSQRLRSFRRTRCGATILLHQSLSSRPTSLLSLTSLGTDHKHRRSPLETMWTLLSALPPVSPRPAAPSIVPNIINVCVAAGSQLIQEGSQAPPTWSLPQAFGSQAHPSWLPPNVIGSHIQSAWPSPQPAIFSLQPANSPVYAAVPPGHSTPSPLQVTSSSQAIIFPLQPANSPVYAAVPPGHSTPSPLQVTSSSQAAHSPVIAISAPLVQEARPSTSTPRIQTHTTGPSSFAAGSPIRTMRLSMSTARSPTRLARPSSSVTGAYAGVTGPFTSLADSSTNRAGTPTSSAGSSSSPAGPSTTLAGFDPRSEGLRREAAGKTADNMEDDDEEEGVLSSAASRPTKRTAREQDVDDEFEKIRQHNDDLRKQLMILRANAKASSQPGKMSAKAKQQAEAEADSLGDLLSKFNLN
ncbi:hypothetical protein BGX29_002060 [Mortierella sp. GBA35]|nr:hypothetical protein BGX29_002060 [Mortierella sp. GBA35]